MFPIAEESHYKLQDLIKTPMTRSVEVLFQCSKSKPFEKKHKLI